MRVTQRRLWRQCKNRGRPKAGSYRSGPSQGRVRNRYSCRKGNLHALRRPWFLAAERSAVLQSNVLACSGHVAPAGDRRSFAKQHVAFSGQTAELPLLRQANHSARQRKAGLPRQFRCRRRKAPMAGLTAAMGGLPVRCAEMVRQNHCFPARSRLCRGRFLFWHALACGKAAVRLLCIPFVLH